MLLEDCLLAADPKRKLAALGAGRTAADRRIEHVNAARRERSVDVAHGRG